MDGVKISISEAGALLSYMGRTQLSALIEDPQLASALSKLLSAHTTSHGVFKYGCNGKVNAVKIYRMLTGAGLKEAIDFINASATMQGSDTYFVTVKLDGDKVNGAKDKVFSHNGWVL